MENLKWEVDQKDREIQSLKQQLELAEQQSRTELAGTQQLLQVPACEGLAGRPMRRPLAVASCPDASPTACTPQRLRAWQESR